MERTYTVSMILEETPCIRITGKWLKKYGIEHGSKIRLVESEEGLLLSKIPDEVWKREQLEKKKNHLEKELQQLKKQL